MQQATFGGIGLVTETAHVEDDARRAAGFALGVEQQVAKQLEEAKRQAHEEVGKIFFVGGGRGIRWAPDPVMNGVMGPLTPVTYL